MKKIILFLAVCFCLLVSTAVLAEDASDPLSSWNDTATKEKIIAFVESVSNISSPLCVPEEDRIAVFDLDGTLADESGFPEIGKPIPIVLKMLEDEIARGSHIVLFSTRLNPEIFDHELERKRIEMWLDEEGVHVDEISIYKPFADVYVDNRAHNPFL